MKHIEQLARFRLFILILFALIVAVSVPGLFRLRVYSDMSNYFVADDPALVNQKKFENLFHSYEFVAVLVESTDVFSRRVLTVIDDLGRQLMAGLPIAVNVSSITTVNSFLTGGKRFRFTDGELVSSDSEIEQVREAYDSIASLNGSLYSDDYTQTWLVVELDKYPDGLTDGATPQFQTGRKAWEIVNSIAAGDDITLTATGIPVYAYRKESEMLQDFQNILLLGAAIAVILSIIILRNFQIVVATILLIVGSLGAVFGIYGWLGVRTDSAFMAVPILLTIGVSIGYSVHISHFFSIKLDLNGNRLQAVAFAVKETWRPILFTVITTVAALLTFFLVDIKPIRWVGYTSAIAIAVVYLLCLTVFPAILLFGNKEKRREKKLLPAPVISPVFVLDSFDKLVQKRRKSIILFFLPITALACYFSTWLEVDFNAEKMMGLALPHMRQQKKISDSAIGSNDFINLTIEFDVSGSLQEARILKNMAALQRQIELLPLIKRTTSIVEYISELNQSLHGGNIDFFVVPDNERQLAAMYKLIKAEIRQNWVTENYLAGRIFIELTGFSSKVIEQTLNEIELLLKEYLPGASNGFFSGSTYLMATMNQYVTRGLARSIALGIVIISILMIIVFRNVQLGLIAMIPNIFPILVCGAVMGIADIPLEFVTMTVAPLIMGLAVDDSIHFICYMEKSIKASKNYTAGVSESFKVVGAAISKTTVIICVTFLVFLISDVNSLKNMGILTFIGMTTAYLADILIAPTLITTLKPIKTDN